MNEFTDCANCPCNTCDPVWPELANRKASKRPRMIILGERPGRDEEREGRYFVGASGMFLNNVLGKLSIPRGRTYITNVLKCNRRQPMSPKEWRQAIKCCFPLLEHELRWLPRTTKTILGYGKYALLATTGKAKIFDWIGAPLESTTLDDYQVLPTLHPAFCLRPQGRSYVPTLFQHTRRAWLLATKKLKPWKWPKIIIEPDKEAIHALRVMSRQRLPVGFDVETRGTDPLVATCMCVGLATKKVAVSVPWEPYPAGKWGRQPGLRASPHAREIRCLVGEILSNKRIPKIFQNGPHDILTARRLGLKVNNYEFDTLLAHAIVSQGTRHDLGFINAFEFHAPRWKSEFHATTEEKGSEAFSGRDPIELRTYNAKDAYMTVLDRGPLLERLEGTHNGVELFTDNYMRNVRVAMEMQARGIRVDIEAMKVHRKKLSQRRSRARYELSQLTKALGIKKYNPRSPKANAALFFRRLGIKPRYFSPLTGQPSLKETALNELVIHPNRMVSGAARALLRYRRWHKLIRTYIDGLKPDALGMIHPTWNVHGARTFRWSSRGPNMQNIPKKKKGSDKPGLRNIFIPTPGNWFVAADYSQLELRIMAQLAGDRRLIEGYVRGDDVHAANARDLFNREDVEGKPRDMAKIAVYRMNYGGEPGGMWRVLVIDFPDITLKQCFWMHKRWFGQHPEIEEFQQHVLRTARTKGYIEAPLSGHRLYFYGQVDPTKCYNYPIQHTAADIINPTVDKIRRALRKNEFIVGQIHDELLLEGPDPVRLGKILKRHMTRKITLNGHKMIYPVDLKASPVSWGDCKEMTLEELKETYSSSTHSQSVLCQP